MQTRNQHEAAKAFANIFAGMTKSFITKDKDNNYETIHREITLADYQDHIKGNVSIGVEPRNDSSKCRFAMLDFDEHKSNKKDVRPFTKEQIKISRKVRFDVHLKADPSCFPYSGNCTIGKKRSFQTFYKNTKD